MTASPPPPIVFIVDDDANMRDTVSRMVRQLGIDVEVFATADAFLAHQRPDRPQCLVLDVMLQGSTGFDVVAALAEAKIEIPTIFMTGSGTIPMSVRAMKSGAVEFLTKPFDSAALRGAIDSALELARAQRERRAELESLEALLGTLTPRELEVLTLVVAGRLNKQIAHELGVVEQTVKVHRARVMEKLGAASVTDLVRLTERVTALRS
jgi:FixJ family two-component response regulator